MRFMILRLAFIERETGPAAVDCGRFSTNHNGIALPPRRPTTATNKVDSMRESLTCAAEALAAHKGFKIVDTPRNHVFACGT